MGCTYSCSSATTTTSTTSTSSTSTTSTTSSTTTSSTTTILIVSYNQTLNFTAGEVAVVNASSLNVTLDIAAENNISNASVTVVSYSGNPTNASFTIPGLGKYIQVNASPTLENALNWTLLRIFYAEEEIASGNLNESTLSIYWLNTTEGEWQRLNSSVSWMSGWVFSSGVNESSDFVWANLSHFSTYTVGGQQLTTTQEILLIAGWNMISLLLNN